MMMFRAQRTVLGVSVILFLMICVYVVRPRGRHINLSSQKQIHLLSGTTESIEEISRYLATLKKLRSKHKYLHNLSAKDIIRQMGVDNLYMLSEISQRQFLNCSGFKILTQIVNSSTGLHIPPSHQRCKNMSFRRSGPIVALGSVPGSGNSWVRQLLESATGIYTGALYCDKSYIAVGMIGEGITTGNVIAIKTHAGPSVTKELINHDKAIYIVRSPFGAILSEQNRHLAKVYKDELSLGDRHTAEVDPKYLDYGMYIEESIKI